MSSKNYADLKKFCHNLGADLFGVAAIDRIKKDFLISQELLEDFDKAVSLGMGLSGAILEEIKDFPTRLYFHHYKTVNTFLDQAALSVCNYIQKKKYSAIPVGASQIVDWQNQKGHLSHKQIGVLAGLGWIGRNNLLVNKELGAQLRLVTILTDMPLKIDKPAKGDCESCKLCIAACPVQAIKEEVRDFEHIKCFEKLKEFQKQKLVDQYICGVCINACRGVKK